MQNSAGTALALLLRSRLGGPTPSAGLEVAEPVAVTRPVASKLRELGEVEPVKEEEKRDEPLST